MAVSRATHVIAARKERERERMPSSVIFLLFPFYSIWALSLWDGAAHRVFFP
jgi:hypothetical protein